MSHTLDRRSALTLMMVAAGGTVYQPAWTQEWTQESLAKIANDLSEGEKLLISAVAETLIPSNGSVGALSAGVDKYLVAYIADCLTAQEQAGIQQGLYQLDRVANSNYGRFFTHCQQSEREHVLGLLQNSSDQNDRQFFRFMHTRSVQGFTSSEQVLVNYHHYSMTHTFYDGDADAA